MKLNKFGIPKLRKKESLNHYFNRLNTMEQMVLQWVVICVLLEDKTFMKKITKGSNTAKTKKFYPMPKGKRRTS